MKAKSKPAPQQTSLAKTPRMIRLPDRKKAGMVILLVLVLLLLLLWTSTYASIQQDRQESLTSAKSRLEIVNYAIFMQIEHSIAMINLLMDKTVPGETLITSETPLPVLQALWIDSNTGAVIKAMHIPDNRDRTTARQAAASVIRSPHFEILLPPARDALNRDGDPFRLVRSSPKEPGTVQLVILDQQLLTYGIRPLLQNIATLRIYTGKSESTAALISGGSRTAETGRPGGSIAVTHESERHGFKVQSTYPIATALEPHRERTGNRIFAALLGSLLLLAIALFALRLTEYLRRYGLHLEMGRMHAEQASQIKTRFISQISHELRTPLHGIIGYADLIREESSEPTQRESAAAILQSGEHLLTLVNRLLDAAKIETGMRTESGEDALTLLPIDLVPLVRQIVFGHDATARKRSLAMYVNAPTSVTVIADQVALGRILHNLLSNALKFTLKGGIRIEVKRLPGTARVEVIDTGIGIAPEDQALLFGMFVQGSSVDLSRFGGTGLGLYLTKQLVEGMGGEIGFHSSLNAGTTFWFELPLADTEFSTT